MSTLIGPETSANDLPRQFSGLARLYGVANARRIEAAHVVVVGIGGVGSWAAESLARSAVGRLTLIDLDHIAESNINRQIHALTTTSGQAKVQAMRERIALINPVCQVRCVEDFVSADNWPALIVDSAMGPPTAVIDACDQLSAKLVLATWAKEMSVSFISVGAAGGKRQAHLADIADLADCTHDPLLASLRSRLRRLHGAPGHGKKMGIACVFSAESVQSADPSCDVQASDGSLNCHGYGSLVSVTATFGQCAAGWVLNQIAGVALQQGSSSQGKKPKA